MKYDKNDPETTKIMGLLALQMLVSGEVEFLVSIGKSIDHARKESPRVDGMKFNAKTMKELELAVWRMMLAVMLDWRSIWTCIVRLSPGAGNES